MREVNLNKSTSHQRPTKPKYHTDDMKLISPFPLAVVKLKKMLGVTTYIGWLCFFQQPYPDAPRRAMHITTTPSAASPPQQTIK